MTDASPSGLLPSVLYALLLPDFEYNDNTYDIIGSSRLDGMYRSVEEAEKVARVAVADMAVGWNMSDIEHSRQYNGSSVEEVLALHVTVAAVDVELVGDGPLWALHAPAPVEQDADGTLWVERAMQPVLLLQGSPQQAVERLSGIAASLRAAGPDDEENRDWYEDLFGQGGFELGLVEFDDTRWTVSAADPDTDPSVTALLSGRPAHIRAASERSVA